ncbi:aminotransferase class I/II-fold pyridoxal phosphate-dependent enzyme, partial [Haliangium sp.]|uniref:aminotransferase class I/II-fold pyridoxal phosphate-dependent enzyme n=1 Tax=Haliangium sp. TaxID=2663208 RepID=UPI003D1002D0
LLGDRPAPAGVEPLTLSIGEPQHPPPALVTEAVAANAHLWHRYPAIDGTPEFRRAAAEWLEWRYRLGAGAVDPDREVLPVAGTREALFLIALATVPPERRGRKPLVILPNPFYHPYAAAAVAAGAEALYLPATPEHDFLPDYAGLDPDTLDRTALVYACSPANPQGTIASVERQRALLVQARAHDFVVAADECYAEIYDHTPPPGALEAARDLGPGWDNLIVFHSLSKRSSAAGLRSGFIAGDPALIDQLRLFRSYAAAVVPGPILAASTALWRDHAHAEECRRRYQAKIDLAESILGGRLGFFRPPGAFYLWLDVGDGEAAALRLWTEAGLRVLPGAYLAHDLPGQPNPGARYIRAALVHDLTTLTKALGRIVAVLG